MTALTMSQVNAMSAEAFVAAFGDIAEHSPWVAARAAEFRPFRDRGNMIDAFAQVIDAASPAEALALLNDHPDLGARARMAADSVREQAGAGLDSLTEAEYRQFTALNTRYRRTFGFPFILAVKGADKRTILEAFTTRVDNDRETEHATALAQVKRIIGFRLEDRVAP